MIKSPHIIWASVAIIFMLIAGVVLLSLNGKDVAIVMALAGIVAVPVLSAFGVAVYQKLDQVKSDTNMKLDQVTHLANGSQTQLLDMIKELHNTVTELALKVKPVEHKNEVPWEK